MPVCKRSNDTLGFTLIELLLGICLLCLIVTLAVPTYGHWIASRQLANHAEFLTETLNLARSEAVKRGLRVNLCKTVDRSQCADTGGWESGWIMFVDANKSGEIEAGRNAYVSHAAASVAIANAPKRRPTVRPSNATRR